MWSDNETTRDYLNFGVVAKTVAEIIEQSQSKPISIGVSGAWGIGKSSMIKLIQNELIVKQENTDNGNTQYIFVEFNAWLYQGYDDARAALIDVVTAKIAEEAEKRQGLTDKITELFERVRWFRLMAMSAVTAASVITGIPLNGVVGKTLELFSDSESESNKASIDVDQMETEGKKYIKEAKDKTPPKQIQALRDTFANILGEMGVTLVVLIDDLDRCLPETTISTLEAIRLLLFLPHTAFVIAADDQMIKHAVKKHFSGIEDELVINYFDKLIQVPIRVPPLGTHEVRAYMMMMFIDNSTLPDSHKDHLQQKICEQLGKAWQGNRVDINFVKNQNATINSELELKLELADRLAVLMTQATGIAGNPRLIKRFMNALSIRLAMARSQGITLNEGALVKILLFERCAQPKAYTELVASVMNHDSGKPTILKQWESEALAGKDINLSDHWDDSFVKDWLKLQPMLADEDLRGVLYVSREHAPFITKEDRLSTEAIGLLEALLNQASMAGSLFDSLRLIGRHELNILMDKVLIKAQQETEWGAPDILESALVLAKVDELLGQRLANFFKDRPPIQVKASIVPKISDQTWSKSVFEQWKDDEDISRPVKNAISSRNNRRS
ncbi:P-loop NTPase fold protein [Acinetobacter baumannii]